MNYPNIEPIKFTTRYSRFDGRILYNYDEKARENTPEILKLVYNNYKLNDILAYCPNNNFVPTDRLLNFNSDGSVLLQDIKNGQLFTIMIYQLYYNYNSLYGEISILQKIKNIFTRISNGQ